MTDDDELIGLDPFDALDREAARIDGHLSVLPDDEWARRSRCAGWSVRDVLAHLDSAERYHRACLAGQAKQYLQEQRDRGASDIAAANALDIAGLADRTPRQLLVEWRKSNAETRRRFRERGDGRIDTSIGNYPSRWQAFHVAGELATHADDIFVAVDATDAAPRRSWRAAYSRFALAEEKPDLAIQVDGGRTRISGREIDVELDDDELIDAVAGRLDESTRLDAPTRAVLNTMP